VLCAGCRDQLDASYDKLKALRQEEAALLGELAAQQASTTSSADELAGLQAQLEEASRRKVRWARQRCERLPSSSQMHMCYVHT
jgi:uncharacterized protein (DUF3084 family)